MPFLPLFVLALLCGARSGALDPAPLIANHFVYASPGTGSTLSTDAEADAGGELLGLAWHRKTAAGARICFSTALPGGGPFSAPIVVGSLLPSELLTAGPRLTRMFARDYVVAYAFVSAAKRPVVRLVHLGDGGTGVWAVLDDITYDTFDFAPWDFVDGLDVARTAESSTGTVAWTMGGDLLWANYAFDTHGKFVTSSVRHASSPSTELWRNPSLASGAGLPHAVFEVWAPGKRSIAVYETTDTGGGPFLLIAGDGEHHYTDPSLGGAGVVHGLALIERSEQGTAIVATSVELSANHRLAGPLVTLATVPAGVTVRPPSIAMVGWNRYFAAWKTSDGEGWVHTGVGLDRTPFLPCEAPFEIAKDAHDVAPRVAETPASFAFVAWGGSHPSSPDPETRAALVKACD